MFHETWLPKQRVFLLGLVDFAGVHNRRGIFAVCFSVRLFACADVQRA